MTTEEKYNKALELARTYYNGGNEFLDTIFPELKESEDERIRRDIIHYILYKADGVSEEQEHSWIAYLEKQKEQKPAEWSEEDEKMRDNIICILQKDITYTPPTRPNSCTGSGNAFYTHQTEIDWLKSLRSQSQWKPSDEQMDALKRSIEWDDERADDFDKTLQSLYLDLQKL